jgi:hypothetical protein
VCGTETLLLVTISIVTLSCPEDDFVAKLKEIMYGSVLTYVKVDGN